MLAQTRPIPSHGEQQGQIGVSAPHGGSWDPIALEMPRRMLDQDLPTPEEQQQEQIEESACDSGITGRHRRVNAPLSAQLSWEQQTDVLSSQEVPARLDEGPAGSRERDLLATTGPVDNCDLLVTTGPKDDRDLLGPDGPMDDRDLLVTKRHVDGPRIEDGYSIIVSRGWEPRSVESNLTQFLVRSKFCHDHYCARDANRDARPGPAGVSLQCEETTVLYVVVVVAQ